MALRQKSRAISRTSKPYRIQQASEYGRSTGYHSRKSGTDMNVVSISYAEDGRIGSVSFKQGNAEKKFTYSYLQGADLLESLMMPNNILLTQSYEEKRNLLTAMSYTRGNLQVTLRRYTYDKLSRPIDRTTEYPQKKQQHTAAFGYNNRSELTTATLDETDYGYNYDNIGNRITAQEAAEQITYDANNLNQYTQIDTDGTPFVPEYDADGNQTLIKTSTGIWRVKYNGQNRAIRFESEDGTIVITCDYDYMGRRAEKKVETNGEVTSHIRYVYRGYLQIAAYDLLQEGYPSLWQIIWDPTQTIATRPLAIRMNGTFYTYGWDLTKNICETYAGGTGYLANFYTYSPYGQVTASGDAPFQPIQWSSEVYDEETGLVYYNYRYYNPVDGRWTRRDPMEGNGDAYNQYLSVLNRPNVVTDSQGLVSLGDIIKTLGVASGILLMVITQKLNKMISNMVNMCNDFRRNADCAESCKKKCGSAKRCEQRNGCCMKRTTQENGEKLPANGCGSEEFKVLDTVSVFGHYYMDFTTACNNHDNCYSKCGNKQSDCDDKFLSDMIYSCRTMNQDEILLTRMNSYIPCLDAALTYYAFVFACGKDRFNDAQDKVCKWETCKK